MWVKREAYIRLREVVAAQSQTIEMLRLRCNELAEEVAKLKGDVLGIPPTRVPVIERADPAAVPAPAAAPKIHATPKVRGRVPEGPSMQDVLAGTLNWEDMGDEQAKHEGVDWDPSTGLVRYQS